MATEISELGEFGLIEKITGGFDIKNKSTVKGVGDDAAILIYPDTESLISSELLLEGIHFDLIYTPLMHLGYKAVIAGISDIYAMYGIPRQIMVNIGLSAKFNVEQVEELYKGIKVACDTYGTDLVGGDTSSSLTGLTISVTAIGKADKGTVVYRNGANLNDLICVTGNLGAAFMGLQLLEREKIALDGVDNPVPQFNGHEYVLRRQLKPEARREVIESMKAIGLVPTSMIDLTDGLASDLLHICKQSDCGARIYLNRIPIAKETFAIAEEMNFDPVVAALNGGEDYELLFTVPISMQSEISNLPDTEIIGHITKKSTGVALTTPDGQDIDIQAPGWKQDLL
ncbi:MAG: thiamine-phosphate kinase [Rikenellaceae bacterium]|nr:thiamine-phosphate kinase [Rikenellaceae bacterium]